MLLHLANQAEGFTPAQKAISNATGIDEADIKRIRERLRKMTVIDYKYNMYEHFYFINWTVIRGYALLDQPLKVGGNKRPYFVQQPQGEYMNNPLQGIHDEYLQYLAHMNTYEIQQLLDELNE